MIQINSTLKGKLIIQKNNRFENNESTVKFCQRRPHRGSMDKNMRLNII